MTTYKTSFRHHFFEVIHLHVKNNILIGPKCPDPVCFALKEGYSVKPQSLCTALDLDRQDVLIRADLLRLVAVDDPPDFFERFMFHNKVKNAVPVPYDSQLFRFCLQNDRDGGIFVPDILQKPQPADVRQKQIHDKNVSLKSSLLVIVDQTLPSAIKTERYILCVKQGAAPYIGCHFSIFSVGVADGNCQHNFSGKAEPLQPCLC